MKILYLGDSVTDSGRDKTNPADLGNGYVKYATENIKNACPDMDISFYNRGISGNRTEDVVVRLDSDVIAIDPDITVLLIGINDVWHHYTSTPTRAAVETPTDRFEANLRKILDAIKSCNSKLVMLEPFALPRENLEIILPELDEKIRIERRLAREYADIYISLHGRFAEMMISADYTALTADGVHPNDGGKRLIGGMVSDAVLQLIQED